MHTHATRREARAVRRSRRIGWLSIVLLALAVGLVGCGGGGNTSTTTTHATTTSAASARFVAKLDDICERGNARVAARYDDQVYEAAKAGNHAKLATLLERLQRLDAPFAAEFAKLPPAPAGDAAAFTRYKEAQNRIEGIQTRLIAALKAKDDTEVTRLLNLADKERAKRKEAALDLGLAHCGS